MRVNNSAFSRTTPYKDRSRTFVKSWFKMFPWLSLCTTDNKAFCYACRLANKGKTVMPSKQDVAFTTTGFNNWKNGIEETRSLCIPFESGEERNKDQPAVDAFLQKGI